MGFFKTLTGKVFAYNDGSQAVPGTDRAAMGNLDAYTGPNGVTSPAQAGFRAIDPLGNAIFDSMGLIATLKLLASGNQTGGAQNFTATTPTDVPGTFADFSISRQTNLMVFVIYTGKVTAGTNNGQLIIDVGALGATGTAYLGVPNYITLFSFFFVTQAAAGAYRAKLQAQVDVAATTLQLLGSTINVFSFGS